jgi:phosphatidylglycerophosphate synthase
MYKKAPIVLIIFRLILAPTILGLTYFLRDEARTAVLILMYLGLVSDIFDGIIARHLNVSSPALRRFDSQTDMLFWLSIGVSSWLLHPDLIANNKIAVITILFMEVMCYVVSLLKFKKETCTHAFLSKLWGITLLIAFTSLIGFGYAGLPFAMAIAVGLIAHLDRILITLILPTWTHDIPSAYHAYLIRKGIAFKRNKLFN